MRPVAVLAAVMRRSAVLVLAALLQAGCLVNIEHTTDPTAAFQEARTEALRFQGKPGPAHRLNVLVYDPGDHEMMRVSLPMSGTLYRWPHSFLYSPRVRE